MKKDKVIDVSDTESTRALDPEEAVLPRVYEIGYHIIPTIKDEEIEQAVAGIRAFIEGKKGTFIAEGAPTSVKLAYPMAVLSGSGKRTVYERAHFGWFKFEVSPEVAVELNATLSADKHILRFIIYQTVREDTRAAARQSLIREVRRTDGADAMKKVKVEEKSGPVSEEQLDKAIEDVI